MFIKGRRTSTTNRLELQLLEAPILDAWEIPACHVIIEERLGGGCFGEVYKGYIQGTITNPKLQSTLKNSPCQTVAIKLLKGELSIHVNLSQCFTSKNWFNPSLQRVSQW